MELIESPTPYLEILSREGVSAEALMAVEALQRIITLQAAALEQKDRLIDEANGMALTDSLTGLGNRRAFDHDLEMLAHDLASMNRNDEGEASRKFRRMLILGDIDYFKLVNDILGYDLGDTTLVTVAGLLRKSMRREDKLYRIGGDEFAAIIIVKRGMESSAFQAIAQKFYRYLNNARSGEELSPEVEALQAIGMSFAHGVFSNMARSIEELTQTVNATMWRVKEIKEIKRTDLRV